MIFLWIFLAIPAVILILALLLILFGKLKIMVFGNNEDIIALKFYFCGIPVYSFNASDKEHPEKVRISDYTLKKIEKRRKKQALKMQKKKQKEKAKQKEGERRSVDVVYIIKFIFRMIKVFAEQFAYKFKVRLYRMNIRVATDDPAKTAVLYGTVIQSASYLVEFLRNNTAFSVPKNASMNITSDFCSDKTLADIKISVIIHVRRVIALIYKSGLRSINDFKKFFK